MTSETRTTIEPEDIRAVELECVKCGYRSVRNVDNWLHEPIACPNCHANWLHLREDFGRIATLVNMLNILSRKQDSPEVVIRFELVAPKRKDAQ